MRKLSLLVLLAGCGVHNYRYDFVINDLRAHNARKPGERSFLEDDMMKVEILPDPTSFQAILVDVTNKTTGQIAIGFDRLRIIDPEKNEVMLHPDATVPAIDPGVRQTVRLIPFQLPGSGPRAAAYEGTTFELIIPMWIGGALKEYHYPLIAHTRRL